MIKVIKGRSRDLSLSPEWISAMVLAYLKKGADEKCLQSTKKVVIPVHSNFNNYWRCATINAAKIADLDPVCVLSEPTSAYIKHAYYKGYTRRPYNVLVNDFGGGTLDVSLVNINGVKFTVLARAGDAHCGGEDIDHAIFDLIVHKMKEEGFPDIKSPTAETAKKYRRLKAIILGDAEEAKRNLSTSPKHEIFVSNARGEEPLRRRISICWKIFWISYNIPKQEQLHAPEKK